MYIQNANTATRRLGGEAIYELTDGSPVEFDEQGKARVTREVGEYLADTYSSISIVDREDSSGRTADDNDSDSSGESADPEDEDDS